jgi:hypothetical protein
MARRVTPSHVGLCRGPLSNWRDIGHVRLSGCCRRPLGSQGSLGHSRSAFRRPCSRTGALVLAVRTGSVGHAGTDFDEEMLRSLTARCSGYPVRRSRLLYSVPRLHQWAVASLTEPQPLKALRAYGRASRVSRATTVGVMQVIRVCATTFPVFTRHPAYRCNAANGFHSERAGARLKLCAEAAPKFAIDVRTASSRGESSGSSRANVTTRERKSSGIRFHTRSGRGLRSSSASGPPV